MQEENEILDEVVDAFTNKPDVFWVDVKPKNKIEKILLKFRLKPQKRRYELTRLVTINAFRIAKEAKNIPDGILRIDEEPDKKEVFAALEQHMDKIVNVVAVGLYNGRDEPPESLKKDLWYEWTDDELIAMYVMIIKRYHTRSFWITIASMMGTNILTPRKKASPNEVREKIAPTA